MNFSILAELAALIIIFILIMFHFDDRRSRQLRSRLFSLCLGLAVLSIFINILSVCVLDYYNQVPYWLNHILCGLYYLTSNLMCSATASYLFYLIFENTAETHCLKYALIIIGCLTSAIILLLVVNIPTGCLFYFQDGQYYHGWANYAGYAALGIELTMLLACFFRNRRLLPPQMKKIIRIMPPVIIIMTVFQLVYPELLMNGLITALCFLIIFISFQNSRVEQNTLTFLENQTTLYTELDYCLNKKRPVQLILIHLLKFGAVNQKFGYQNGNRFLKKVARSLENYFPTGQVFHVGNVEFAVLHEFKSEEDALARTESARLLFSEPWTVGSFSSSLPAAITDIICKEESFSSGDVMERLQFGMDCAKKNNPSYLIHFDSSWNQLWERRNLLFQYMKKNIAENNFEVFYQPVFCYNTGRFCSAEALVRMRDPEGNLISPGEFIPLAEQAGLIGDITWIVLEKVCSFLGLHPELPLKAVSINVSAQQLSGSVLFEHIEEALYKYHVPAEKLRIEITERMITSSYAQAKEIIEKLINKKIQFYLDDFGVGYSNFKSMLELPFEAVKLDHSIVSEAFRNPHAFQTVGILVEMLHQAGYVVIAEGIETQKQEQRIRLLEVDRIQGYYHARPMPETELLEFYRNVNCCGEELGE